MAEDFSKFGKPVESSVEDFSSFGKPVEADKPKFELPEGPSPLESLKKLYGAAEAAVVGGVATVVPPIMAVGTTISDTVARKAAELSTGENIPGDSIGNRYMRAYEKHSKIGVALQEQMTPAGQEILDVVSRVITAGTKSLGNTAFEAQRKLEENPLATLITGKSPVPIEKSSAPEVATLIESLATIAPFAIGAKKGAPKKTGTFADDYSTVNAAIEASHVGDAPVQAAVKADPTKPITSIIHEQLDKELGVPAGSPEVAAMSIADKLDAVITIASVKANESIPRSDVTNYVNQVVGAIEQMQKQQDAVIATARAKGAFEKAMPQQLALPKPSPLGETVFVSPAGEAATATQKAMLDQIMQDLTRPAQPLGLPKPSPVKGIITVDEKGVAQTPKQRMKGGKQAGVLGVEGIEKIAVSAEEAAKAAVQKGWAVPNPAEVADRVARVMEENRQAMESSRKANAGKFIANVRRMTIAHDYDLRAALKETPAGQEALHREVVRNGATMAAKVHMDAATAGIFNKFNHKDLQAIDEITRLRRIVQIDKYRGIGSTRHEGGVTGPEASARLQQLEQTMGKDAFENLKDASSAIFEEEKKLLNMRLEKGLISKELYDKLKDFNYTRTEYIDMVDPSIPIHSRIRNMPLSIRGSGIPELGHGKTMAVNMDNQALLMEDMARAYNAVFKNDALLAMRDLAVREADNGIVRLPAKESITVQKNGDMKMKHTPEGWTAIGLRNEGRQEFILMKDEFAEQFVARPEASLAEYMATIFRIASGTSAIKYTSTGANPGFVLAGIPMDIWHTWVATSGSYSPHLPIGISQIGKDMTATAKDAWTRKGSWIDAMNEGIGSSYMTHEARGLTDPTKSIKGIMAPKMQKIREVLSYVNESADMWMRLAYRKRLIDQGVPSWEATAMSRDRLDYYQGGPVAKAFDAIFPYTNVAIQATAKGAEKLIKPLFTDVAPQYALSGVKAKYTPRQEALIKASWIVGTAAAVKLASMVTSPETDKNISVTDKVRNYNITFGDHLYVLDPNGNKRYFYVPVRLDQTVMPFNAAVVGGLELAEYGSAPRGLTAAAIGQISPVSQEIPIPSIEAIASYVHNYDSYTDSPVYKGPKVLPEAEIRTFGQGQPTSPFAVAAGQALGMSPVRLENSIGKVINYNNFYIKSMGFMAKEVFEGADPREQAMAGLQMLQNVPGLSGVVKLTTPYNSLMEELMDAEQQANTPVALATSGLNDLLFQYQKGQNNVTTKTLQTYINNQPAEYRQKLADHAKYTMNVDKVMSRYQASDKIPPRAWWIAASKAPAEARAQVFYNEWVSAEPEDRQRMLGIAQGLQNSGVGFLSDDFKRAFALERKMLGDDHR